MDEQLVAVLMPLHFGLFHGADRYNASVSWDGGIYCENHSLFLPITSYSMFFFLHGFHGAQTKTILARFLLLLFTPEKVWT